MSFTSVKMRTPDGAEYGPVAVEELLQWQQQGRVPPGTIIIDVDTGEEKPFGDFSPPGVPAPMVMPPPPENIAQQQPNHLIPTKNPQALWAYYLSIGSLLCCGPLLGIPALILGLLGLEKAKTVGEGKTHSIVALVLACITSIGYTVIYAFLYVVRTFTSND